MQPHLTILPLSNVHRDEVAALILPIQRVEFNVPITLADQPDLSDLETAYFRPGGHFWGAFLDGELAGTIGLLVPDRNSAPLGVIRKMFVKPSFRGKQWGVARQLLQALVAYSRENGLERLYLGTISRMKAAHRFYEKHGFERVDKHQLPAIFPLMPVDDVFYHLEIKAFKAEEQ